MAKDAIHDAVKNALIKDGWTIIREHFQLSYGELEGYVDIAAERQPIVATRDNNRIVVEVKTFSGRSFMREFQQAIGQYELYRDLIELTQQDFQLILAVSDYVYNTYFTRPTTTLVIQRHQMHLLVINVKNEEVFKWVK